MLINHVCLVPVTINAMLVWAGRNLTRTLSSVRRVRDLDLLTVGLGTVAPEEVVVSPQYPVAMLHPGLGGDGSPVHTRPEKSTSTSAKQHFGKC